MREEFVLRAAQRSAVATLLVVIALVAHAIRVGSGRGGWFYAYVGRFFPQLLLPFLVELALALGMLWISSRIFERHEHLTVIGWLGVGLLALRWYAPASLESIVRSDGANAFFTATLGHRALDFLTHYPAIRETLPLHAQANMPGKAMIFFLLEQFSTTKRGHCSAI